MRISIFGLGYVGAVSAACLARDGHEVIGVDPATHKVELINAGHSPIIEAGLEPLIAAAVDSGRLRATSAAADAVAATELSIVCVGTPSAANGSLDLRYVDAVCGDIGDALREQQDWHTVVIRSTILPGTMRRLVIPRLEEASGKRAGQDFGLCNNPEFLREGTAIHDYDHPPKTVIGAVDERSAAPLRELYEALPAPLFVTDIEIAELVKYVDNVWHALKVGFANEIGALCKPLGIDSHQVMEIFCQDTKLNISPYYLRPGFAFGGSCLPKDVRALNYESAQLDLKLPIIGAIMDSNRLQVERGLELIMAQGRKRIGVLGFSFKAGTDDLRESPIVELIERLIGKGYDLRLYDRNVNLARLVGANREYILGHIPHIERLMVDSLEELLEHAELVVIGNPDPEFRAALRRIEADQRVVDLVRIDPAARSDGGYEGLSW
ncbi:MAG: UDP-glucose/GDP-mannose dehydrogenase family protein [Gammaproteobacteria bacterium]|nr:MAG: UDP-glucose/GDP-mannose dehydrogenase family protein [Gammaproteobacteria bacterium]